MPDLAFAVRDAAVVPFAASPTLAFKLGIENRCAGEKIHTVALRCQLQIETARRRYSAEEQERMLDLFGAPSRWSQTLHSLLWINASMVVPGFETETVADLQIGCTFDFNIATTKYFAALSGGDLPLQFLFSGTVFYEDAEGALQAAPISWEQEARYKLPVSVWHGLMDSYYPNTICLNLRRDVFERLCQYKMQHGIPTWEQALESVLPVEDAVAQ